MGNEKNHSFEKSIVCLPAKFAAGVIAEQLVEIVSRLFLYKNGEFNWFFRKMEFGLLSVGRFLFFTLDWTIAWGKCY